MILFEEEFDLLDAFTWPPTRPMPTTPLGSRIWRKSVSSAKSGQRLRQHAFSGIGRGSNETHANDTGRGEPDVIACSMGGKFERMFVPSWPTTPAFRDKSGPTLSEACASKQ